MQLYQTNDISIHASTCTILDPRIIHQLKRVMRARIGLQIMVQSPQEDSIIRYLCGITSIESDTIHTKIIDTSVHPRPEHIKHLVVAMSNKRDKMELITQKACECGITDISIIPMHRSIIRQSNKHKLNRIDSIALEATEQSRSTTTPNIKRYENWDELTLSGPILLCDMGGQVISNISIPNNVTVIIGPEGGIDPRDISILQQKQLDLTTISLGSTILRMETAAIIGSRYISQ